MAKDVFESLINAGEAYKTKNGLEFRAQLSGFIQRDATVREAGKRFVISTFTSLSGSEDLINKALKTDFMEDEEFHTIPANLSWFVETEEEAEALAAQMVKGTRIQATVAVSTHEYDDNLYLDLRVDTPFLTAGQGGGNAPKRKSAKEAEIDDDDMPI